MCSLSHSKYHSFRICYSCMRLQCYWRLLWFCNNHIAVQFKGKTKVWGFQTNNIWIFRSTSSLELNFCCHEAEFLCVTRAQILYEKHTQLKKLTTELNCLPSASALMGMVYNFIDEYKTFNHLSPSFTNP